MLLEKDLKRKISNCLCSPKYSGRVKVQNIESGMTGLGIPDIFFRTNIDTWMETKRIIIKSNNISKVTIPFQPGQYKWIDSYRKLGGHILLACLIIDKLSTYNNHVYFFRGSNIKRTYLYDEFFMNYDSLMDYDHFNCKTIFNIVSNIKDNGGVNT